MTSELRREIEACNSELTTAFSQQNYAKMANFYTEDCKIMEPGAKESIGRSGVIEVFKRQHNSGAAKVELHTEEVGSLGPEICYERHNFKTFKVDNSSLEEGKSLVIWKCVDGKWQIYIDIFNSNE